MRHLLALHGEGGIGTAEAMERLALGRSQFHRLRASYLEARAGGRGELWEPGASGGTRHPRWPAEVRRLAGRLLTAHPPASYSLVASELLRRTGFRTDRSSVRRWAAANGCAAPPRPARKRAAVRRWQRQSVGELWQMDATPHAFVPGRDAKWHLIDIIDDCSRVVTGARLYEREILPSYYDILPRAFLEHGLPLALYVDYHSFFHTHKPDTLTELGAALRFYGVSLQYASTPQAKGKVERLHHYWQNRLPALFGAEGIRGLEDANALLEDLRAHRNAEERHRELDMTPEKAWDLARKEKRDVLRPCRPDAWWHYVWSSRTGIRVGDDGRVPVAGQRLKVQAPPRTRLVHCLHTNGSISILAEKPDKKKRPRILLHLGPKLE